MKTYFIAFGTALMLAVSPAFSAEKPAQKKGSTEFEKMKRLVGTWKGTVDMGNGPEEMTVQYRLLAGGSVLEERSGPGTENEMVTMYYDKDGKLSLTHYCVMGNRPQMFLESARGETLQFAFDKSCGIDPAKEDHMHALKIKFDDADTITTSCKGYMGGKETPEHPSTFKRVKS